MNIPLEVDRDERRPSRIHIQVVHPLLADEDNLVQHTHSEDRLEIGRGRPVEVLYHLLLPEIYKWGRSRVRRTYAKTWVCSRPVENSDTFESQIVIS
jgi:hypothetical protein